LFSAVVLKDGRIFLFLKGTATTSIGQTRPSRNTVPVLLTKKRFCLIAAALCLAGSFWVFLGSERMPGHQQLKRRLSAHLSMAGQVPAMPNDIVDPSGAIIYVLGGSEKSLEARLRTAARLHRAGEAQKILFFAAPGITRFDPALGRNLTNQEWTLRELQALGVGADFAEPLALEQPACFGTRAEARALAGRSGERGYRSVVLVTSALHGRRALRTFIDAFKEYPDARLVLSLTEEQASLEQLLVEYGKLLLYTTALLRHSAS
jgi:uncharacterized SAM-binding protein YcdF (DUF218 family)